MKFKLIIVWLAILIMMSFWLTVRASSDPVSLVVIPEVPREGEPIIATFKLNNPSSSQALVTWQFYANGELLKKGTAFIASDSGKTYQYVYENPLKTGEQINFLIRTQSELKDYEKVSSSPPYPPQIWSSFVSFGAFSTQVMGYLISTAYYQTSFSSNRGINVGIIVTLVLITLLIFVELTQPVIQGKSIAVLGRLRIRFSTLTWILFIIFMGIVYTKVVIISVT